MTKTRGTISQQNIRIGIDCRLSGTTHAGIGRYIENLITRLPVQKTPYHWVLFFHEHQQIPTTAQFQKAVAAGQISLIITPVSHYTLQEQLQMPRYFAAQNLDLLHVPHFNVPLGLPRNLRLIITIHDLLWHQQRGSRVTTLHPWKYWIKYLGYRIISQLAVHRAETILVPSQTVAQTVASYYPKVEKKVVVTYEGVDTSLLAGDILSSTSGSKTLLYVGSLYPHKNISVVLKALQLVPEFTLEIAGSRSIFRDQVAQEAQELGVEDRVHFLGYLPDTELQTKYQTSLALVQPSLSEGFGLTGLEAMAAGGLVLASDIPVFREIYQEGAEYFDPYSAESFAQKVKILSALSTQKRHQRQQQNQTIAGQYSWDTMTNQTVACYHKLLTASH